MMSTVTHNPVVRGLKYLDYASAVGEGEVWCRDDFAKHFGVRYSTAQYHADRAVEQGLLVRQIGYVDTQPGYLYTQPTGEH